MTNLDRANTLAEQSGKSSSVVAKAVARGSRWSGRARGTGHTYQSFVQSNRSKNHRKLPYGKK